MVSILKRNLNLKNETPVWKDLGSILTQTQMALPGLSSHFKQNIFWFDLIWFDLNQVESNRIELGLKSIQCPNRAWTSSELEINLFWPNQLTFELWETRTWLVLAPKNSSFTQKGTKYLTGFNFTLDEDLNF